MHNPGYSTAYINLHINFPVLWLQYTRIHRSNREYIVLGRKGAKLPERGGEIDDLFFPIIIAYNSGHFEGKKRISCGKVNAPLSPSLPWLHRTSCSDNNRRVECASSLYEFFSEIKIEPMKNIGTHFLSNFFSMSIGPFALSFDCCVFCPKTRLRNAKQTDRPV